MFKNIHDSIKFTTEQHKLYVRQLKSEQTYFIKKLIQYDVLNLTLVTTNNVKTIYLFSLARQSAPQQETLEELQKVQHSKKQPQNSIQEAIQK